MNLKKIGSILFHRTALVALFLLFQIGLLMVTIVRFSDYFIPIYLFCATVSLFVVLYIINKKGDPGYKIAWIIPIMLAPVFGGLVYLLCGASGLSKRDQKKMESMDRHLIEALDRDKKSMGCGEPVPLSGGICPLPAVHQHLYPVFSFGGCRI